MIGSGSSLITTITDWGDDGVADLLAAYRNGNYRVDLCADGTKVRTLPAGESDFQPEFPENIDLKVTDYCGAGCAWCHEGSTVHGRHGDLSAPFLTTLRPGTELAIGGGNPLDHPELPAFLRRMHEQGVVCNLTVNQIHLESMRDSLDVLISEGLVYGVGISYMRPSDRLIAFLRDYPHAVLHVIHGVASYADLECLSGHGIKLLLLGYKTLRRGETFRGRFGAQVAARQATIYANIHRVLRGFEIVSFDNLAIEQLRLRRLFTSAEWDRFYMGDDGTHTMFIDVVTGEFAVSSTSQKRWALRDTVDAMFQAVRADAVTARTEGVRAIG